MEAMFNKASLNLSYTSYQMTLLSTALSGDHIFQCNIKQNLVLACAAKSRPKLMLIQFNESLSNLPNVDHPIYLTFTIFKKASNNKKLGMYIPT